MHKLSHFCKSFPRRRESRGLAQNWIPTYAGMTARWLLKYYVI